MHFILKIIFAVLINALAIYAASYFVEGFILTGAWTDLLIVAIIFTLLNLILRPILKLVLGPLLLLTLGLGIIIVNMLVLYILDIMSDQITINGYLPLFWGTLIIGIVNSILHFAEHKKSQP